MTPLPQFYRMEAADLFTPDTAPGRVCGEQRGRVEVCCEGGVESERWGAVRRCFPPRTCVMRIGSITVKR